MPGTLADRIVFVRAEGNRNVLMAMNPDGTDLVSLGAGGVTPHVSPDGRRVVYATPAEGIAVLDLATGKETVVAPRLSVRPRWSPSGDRILFWSDRGGTKEIYVMNGDGSGVVRLTDGKDGYHEADWSPDGSRIVFRRVTGDGGDIWTMNADGSGAAVIYAGQRMDSDPRWSPDGRRIAFVSMVSRLQGDGVSTEIYSIDADGSNLVRLTRHDGEDWSPAWSPDGSKIAFFGYRVSADDPDLFTVNPDGTGLRLLLGGPTYDHGPAYGPNQ
ncbi:MAG: TolB family protein [Gemmatimonadaceae bacterium]